jgi:hypothetical protein
MSSSVVEIREALATRVAVSADTLSVELADGRTITVPLAWYPRLEHASAKEAPGVLEADPASRGHEPGDAGSLTVGQERAKVVAEEGQRCANT